MRIATGLGFLTLLCCGIGCPSTSNTASQASEECSEEFLLVFDLDELEDRADELDCDDNDFDEEVEVCYELKVEYEAKEAEVDACFEEVAYSNNEVSSVGTMTWVTFASLGPGVYDIPPGWTTFICLGKDGSNWEPDTICSVSGSSLKIANESNGYNDDCKVQIGYLK